MSAGVAPRPGASLAKRSNFCGIVVSPFQTSMARSVSSRLMPDSWCAAIRLGGTECMDELKSGVQPSSGLSMAS